MDYIKASFKYLGNETKGDVKNAADYGVPQNREK